MLTQITMNLIKLFCHFDSIVIVINELLRNLERWNEFINTYLILIQTIYIFLYTCNCSSENRFQT